MSNCSKATPEQIEKILTTVAKYKGYKEGVRIGYKGNKQGVREDTINPIQSNHFEYENDVETLYLDRSLIYEKGYWAEILPTEPKVKTGWINIYTNNMVAPIINDTKENANKSCTGGIACIKITWEE